MPTRFEERMADRAVRHDTRLLGDFTRIFCDAHHAYRERAPFASDAVALGVHRSRSPLLCDECAGHLEYAEKRRAFCPKDPKPFCAYCDTHCYSAQEAEWERGMMRFSGPRSWRHGHAIDGLKHMLHGWRAKRQFERRAATQGEQ